MIQYKTAKPIKSIADLPIEYTQEEIAVGFGEWLLSHDISFIYLTDKGNVYDYNRIELTMEELHEIYSNQKPNDARIF